VSLKERTRVAAASPKFLRAMKLLASRSERDIDDIKTPYEICGLRTTEEGLAVLESFYPQDRILYRMQFLLQELFPEPPHPSKDNALSL
jgi:hypothetical protein